MTQMHEIDGLIILGITLVAVTVFSALRGMYARSLAARRARLPQVSIPLHTARRSAAASRGPHRKAA